MKTQADKSGELELKKEKMVEHKGIYRDVESRIYEVAGGRSIRHMLQLQQMFKDKLKLKTARVDWRTKVGIILWFCDHWAIVSKVLNCPEEVSKLSNEIANGKKTLTKRPYRRRQPYVKKVERENSESTQSVEDYFTSIQDEETVYFPEEDAQNRNSSCSIEDKNSSSEELSQPEIDESRNQSMSIVLDNALFDESEDNTDFEVVDEVFWTV